MDYVSHLCILICIYAILAQSFNLIFGLGRLLNIAHCSIFAIGAYTTAILATEYQQSVWMCIPASMAFSGFFALIIGAISLRLKNDYFIIGTLAFSSLVASILINFKSLTHGVLGIPAIPRPQIFGLELIQNNHFLLFAFIICLISLSITWFIFKSSMARSLRALADHEIAAKSVAKDKRNVQNSAFIISSIFAGVSGSLISYYIMFIDPNSFGLHEMIFVFTIVIVGKPGSFWGTIVATCFLILLPEPLRFISFPPGILGPIRQLLYSLLLIATLYWKRETLFPLQRSV